jgi:hypothetical protein
MSDILIRDVPDDVVTAIDARAAAIGLSRNEYLRRRLAQDSRVGARRVTLEDLRDFAARCSDLTDPEVMRQAWS